MPKKDEVTFMFDGDRLWVDLDQLIRWFTAPKDPTLRRMGERVAYILEGLKKQAANPTRIVDKRACNHDGRETIQ